MKRALKKLILPLTLLALFSAPHLASAYYDPGAQRWINRDPLEEPGFELRRERPALVLAGEPNRYLFVANDPLDRADYLGLKDWRKVIEAAWWAAQKALPGSEFKDALDVFGGCSSLGLALLWAKTQYDNEMADAILGDPRRNGAAEKAVEARWRKKINLMQKTYDKLCRHSCNATPKSG
jgi:RHS repeat-associated protein